METIKWAAMDGGIIQRLNNNDIVEVVGHIQETGYLSFLKKVQAISMDVTQLKLKRKHLKNQLFQKKNRKNLS
jgi:hypothetical protein